MKNVGMRNCVGVPSDVKSGGRFSFWATTRVAPTKYRLAKKRLHATSLQRNGSLKSFAILGRGYTGHEHLLDHDIINMNGRIYDPVTAQFMQADNYISSPEDYISYNRYAYCRYNPFKYTDPSGEHIVYFDPNFLNEVSEDTQGADSYGSDDRNSMLVEELARLNAWMLDEDVTRSPMASKGGCGGVGSNPGAPVQEKPTVMDLLLKKKEKEVEKFKERAEKIAKAKKANKANKNLYFNDDNVPNPKTWHRNFGIPCTNFTGYNDPEYMNGAKDYTQYPTSLSDFYSRDHDIFYANIGAWTKKYCTGNAWLNDERTLTADRRFVHQQLSIAIDPVFPANERLTAAVAATIIGVGVIKKTFSLNFYCATHHKNANKILNYYDKLGRTNHPTVNTKLK